MYMYSAIKQEKSFIKNAGFSIRSWRSNKMTLPQKEWRTDLISVESRDLVD